MFKHFTFCTRYSDPTPTEISTRTTPVNSARLVKEMLNIQDRVTKQDAQNTSLSFHTITT